MDPYFYWYILYALLGAFFFILGSVMISLVVGWLSWKHERANRAEPTQAADESWRWL